MRYFWMRGPWYMAEGGDGGAGAEAGDAAGEGGRDAAGQQGREAETAGEQSQAAPDEKARKAAWKQAVQQRYGVQNVEDLARAVMNDNAYYEDEASRHGMDVETFKQLEMTRMENQRLREQQEASERDRQTAQKMLGWRQAEAELKKVFPDFSLDAEIESSNGEMFRLLESGVPMDHAYKVLHMDELMQGTLAGAVQRTQQRTLETIAARGMRPAENGVGMSAERAGKFDISKLSRAKMEELERRSARGERITPEKMFE